MVSVDLGAEADLLVDPKRFAAAPFTDIRFSGEGGNRVNLSPARSSVFAIFESGRNLVEGLPADYKEYFVRARRGAPLSAENFNYMLTWSNAVKLEVFDSQDLAYDLAQNIDVLKGFKQLEALSVSAQKQSYKSLQLTTFWDNLPQLKKLSVYAVALDDVEFNEFAAAQAVPSGWTVRVINKTIHYRKQ